jgi:hypothetical protein
LRSFVLVHGLGGHPEDTWTYDPNRLPSNLASLLRRPAAAKVFWPSDLLAPSFPNVRILAYGYDSDPVRVFDNVSRVSVYQHASNLLQDLARDDERVEEVHHWVSSD